MLRFNLMEMVVMMMIIAHGFAKVEMLRIVYNQMNSCYQVVTINWQSESLMQRNKAPSGSYGLNLIFVLLAAYISDQFAFWFLLWFGRMMLPQCPYLVGIQIVPILGPTERPTIILLMIAHLSITLCKGLPIWVIPPCFAKHLPVQLQLHALHFGSRRYFRNNPTSASNIFHEIFTCVGFELVCVMAINVNPFLNPHDQQKGLWL